MDMYEPLTSKSYDLNGQIVDELKEIMPEQGPILAILDMQGNCWAHDHERFTALRIGETFLKELCAKIDDGAEPVVTQSDDFSIIGSQLATERKNCGYVLIALPQYSPESTLINIDLIEMLLNQIELIAKLIERSNHFRECSVKPYSAYVQSGIASN
jgi:hypothetical protein